MSARSGRSVRLALIVAALVFAVFGMCGTIPRTAAAAPIGFGGGCAVYPEIRAATIDSLRFRCSAGQLETIFRAAPSGAVPMGDKDGWVTSSSPSNGTVGPVMWVGKTFYTTPSGGYLLNRTTAGEIWPADVYRAPSRLDGKPCWALNYAPSPTPTVYDEIREVIPGVWLGDTYAPGVYSAPFQLAFVLA